MTSTLKLVLAAAAAAASLGAGAQEVTLKVHHFWPPGAMPPTRILQPWCDKIAADSNNKMKCQIYPAMQLGGTPPQLIDQVKKATEGTDASELQRALDQLTSAQHKAAEALYRQQASASSGDGGAGQTGAPGGASGAEPPKGDVIDAEVVDEGKPQ